MSHKLKFNVGLSAVSSLRHYTFWICLRRRGIKLTFPSKRIRLGVMPHFLVLEQKIIKQRCLSSADQNTILVLLFGYFRGTHIATECDTMTSFKLGLTALPGGKCSSPISTSVFGGQLRCPVITLDLITKERYNLRDAVLKFLNINSRRHNLSGGQHTIPVKRQLLYTYCLSYAKFTYHYSVRVTLTSYQ